MEEKDIIAEQSVENQVAAEPEQQLEQAETVENTENQPEKSEKDSFYADKRRKQELDEIRSEKETLKRQLEMAQKTFGNYFEGETLEEMLDLANAQSQGVDVETIKSQREQTQKQAELESQLKYYQQKEIEKEIESDLKEIQSVDPTITSLDDLPPMFLSLRFNQNAPLSAKEAFIAMKAIEKQTKQQKPASAGSLINTTQTESEYFTSQELDKLSESDLRNPKVYEKAMRSMAKLK